MPERTRVNCFSFCHSEKHISITLVAESHDDAEAKALSLAENNELVGQNEYTMSGFEILNPGKLYVWQIKRSYETTVGDNDDYSPVFVFKILSPK